MLVSFDRFDYCSGTYLFWSDHHSGQDSKGYAILSRLLSRFSPGLMFQGWKSLEYGAREVYRAWCLKEGESCEYDTIKYKLEQSELFDFDDPCVDHFLDLYGDQALEDSGLINYEHSDFVNIDMPYTRDLLRFYASNEQSVLYWIDQYLDAIGYNSRLQALEGQTIETPDDMATALVNLAMTHLAGLMLQTLQEVD